MIPSIAYQTNSKAERIIFDALREAFPLEKKDLYFVFHSLNLPQHQYKRFGEIDFLICCPYGLYVLEVKGGVVACHSGVWSFTDKNKQVNISYEGPFRQAESALHGLMKNLNKNFPKDLLDDFCIGYGVLLPDCKLGVSSAEWDVPVLGDNGAHRNIERWLKGLFNHWRAKDTRKGYPSNQAIMTLSAYLRPDFEAVKLLHSHIDQVSKEINKLTADQINFVDILECNTKIVCEGGAGTGKTFLAMELARRWCVAEASVLLVCRSIWLKNYLDAKYVWPNLVITTLDGLSSACRRADLDQFDALIIDEGQDFLDISIINKLNRYMKGGFEEGRWCFFHDKKNQSGIFGQLDQQELAYQYLMAQKTVYVPLRRNCRNTNLILEKVKALTLADMGVGGAGFGPDVRESHATTDQMLAALLRREINEIVDEGGLTGSELTLLAPEKHMDYLLNMMPSNIRGRLVILDEFSMRNFPSGGIGFSSIQNFKGMENQAIIAIVSPPETNNEMEKVLLYVALSRARSMLSILYFDFSKQV